MPESGTYFRPAGLPGIEALHASFIEHAYRPHSHPTWTVAVIEHGAARFEVDDTRQRADEGDADQAHLTRTFRRSVGVTPARFARA